MLILAYLLSPLWNLAKIVCMFLIPFCRKFLFPRFNTLLCCNVCILIFTVFISFRSCYSLLYQCLVPNTREALSLLVQHYSVPKDFERNILSGENPRVCNQGILNYLLIKLRTDKNFVKFWKVLNLLVNQPELRAVIGRIMKSECVCIVYIHMYM